jgi:hypothetical protein
MVDQVKDNLAPFGAPTSFVYRGKSQVHGATEYDYSVGFKSARIKLSLAIDRDGKIAALGIDSE